MIGDHDVDAYSNIGRVMALYVVMIVSFCFPQEVPVSALRMLSVCLAFLRVFWMCVVNVSFGSNVSPSICGLRFVGINVSLIVRLVVK